MSSFPRKRGLTREEAADVFQAVCVDLVAELPRLRDPQALPAWLMQITRHKVLKIKRKNDRHVAEDVGRAAQLTAPDHDMPDSSLRDLQKAQAVREAIG